MLPLMSAFTGENAVALSMSIANNPCYSASKFHQEQRVATYIRYNLVGIKLANIQPGVDLGFPEGWSQNSISGVGEKLKGI